MLIALSLFTEFAELRRRDPKKLRLIKNLRIKINYKTIFFNHKNIGNKCAAVVKAAVANYPQLKSDKSSVMSPSSFIL